MRMLKYLLKNFNFFCPQKVEKNHPQKLLRIPQIFTALTAQTAQTEEFMFQNVAFRPTVYRTGTQTFDSCSYFKEIVQKAE